MSICRSFFMLHPHQNIFPAANNCRHLVTWRITGSSCSAFNFHAAVPFLTLCCSHLLIICSLSTCLSVCDIYLVDEVHTILYSLKIFDQSGNHVTFQLLGNELCYLPRLIPRSKILKVGCPGKCTASQGQFRNGQHARLWVRMPLR